MLYNHFIKCEITEKDIWLHGHVLHRGTVKGDMFKNDSQSCIPTYTAPIHQ